MATRTHDRLGRRLRGCRVKSGNNIVLTERDYTWLTALHRHGPLPTSYLHAFTKNRWTDYRMASRRLALLFHEADLIDRPFRQFETLDPRSNELVHALSKTGADMLKEAGLFSRYAPASNGPFRHRLMVSCITASVELEAKTKGWRYLSQQELLERAQTTLAIDIDGLLRPDALFALEMAGKYLAFFLEADRATEPLETKNIRKSFGRTVEQYRKLIGEELYKKKFRLNANALLLNVTVSKKRLEHMVATIGKTYSKGCPYILNQYFPEFGQLFKPPPAMKPIASSWERAGYTAFKIGAKF
jgi:hypothetical protein